MAGESKLNRRICDALSGLDPIRVENAVRTGTPDINFAGGWIESKALDFPAKASTVIRIDHYTPQQRAWHARRRHAVRMSRINELTLVALENTKHGDVFLFDAFAAAQHLGVDWHMGNCVIESLLWMEGWNAKSFRAFIDNSLAR